MAIAGMFGSAAAFAQYPSAAPEAEAEFAKTKTEFYRKSDEAWEKALPVVLKEAREGRPIHPLGFPSV